VLALLAIAPATASPIRVPDETRMIPSGHVPRPDSNRTRSAESRGEAAAAGGSAAMQQPLSASAPDGLGGTITVWEDYRSGTTSDIYAQRVDAAGVSQWGPGGVAVCTAAGHQRNPQVASDGSGGAIITWDDVYLSAQRVNAAGVPQWGPNGVAICSAGSVWAPRIVSDGAGGAIVAWQNFRTSSDDIYAQRVDAAGVLQWESDGAAICVQGDDQYEPQIVSDGAGGAIVTWSDYRNGSDYAGVFVQRVNAVGELQWTPDGLSVCTTWNYQWSPRITADGAGGAIIAWLDNRIGTVYAQRVDVAGSRLWNGDGVALSSTLHQKGGSQIVSDGAEGAIVAWEELSPVRDIIAQRVSAAGAPLWAPEGVALCAAPNDQKNLQIVPDGGDGAIVAWEDYRSGLNADIYAQRVDGTGSPQWTPDGAALCTAPDDQLLPQVQSSGAGGAIVTWHDQRSGTDDDAYLQTITQSAVPWWTVYDVYAQRVDGAGATQWTADGLGVHLHPGLQGYPAACTDGAGGAFVAWQEKRGDSFDIYVRRFDSGGESLWPAVAACSASNTQLFPDIVSDGAGGVIVAWQDARSGADFDIYAQRVDAAGVPQWPSDGVALCAAANHQRFPRIVSDGAGGAVATWEDYRGGSAYTSDIYTQRVSAAGVPSWTADGVALSTASGQQTGPQITSDGAGGAVVTWQSFANGALYIADIYVRRVSAAGVAQWTANGVALCTAPEQQSSPQIVSDGAGGAIVAWEDSRAFQENSRYFDIYARRVSAAGVPQWTADGQPLCTAQYSQTNPRIVSDGAGGAIVAWDDIRPNTGNKLDIVATRVRPIGAPIWAPDGVALCATTGDQTSPRLVPDGSGGAIVVWEDYRGGESSDIYVRRVSATGVPQWTANGVAVCAEAGLQWVPAITTDGAGGAFVAWADRRDRVQDLVHAQRVTAGGTLGFPGGDVTPVQVSLVSAEAWPGRVRLAWYSGGDPDLSATVERTVGGGWNEVGSVFADGTGRLTFEDDTVIPGQRFGYRLRIRDGGSDQFSAEAWVEIPRATQLALHGASPNPAVGPIWVSFSLPGRKPARLALYDVVGRRVCAREVGSFGAGAWRVNLGEGAPLPAGIYVVRLTQGSRSLAQQVTLIR
jgi:hypothetical protein